MKRVILTFGVCVGMIVLTNCEQTGGRMDSYTQRLTDNWGASVEQDQRERQTAGIERRLAALEAKVSGSYGSGGLAAEVADLKTRVLMLETGQATEPLKGMER